MPTKRRWLALLIGLGMVVAADQLLHRLVLRDGWLGGMRVAPFDPPLFSPIQFETLERLKLVRDSGPEGEHESRFDPRLGWDHEPGGGAGPDRIDAEGARIDGVGERGTRILAYGCSYTYGTEVGPRDAWPARLSGRLTGTRVLNLGVPGFGVDQAYLRWREQRLAGAEVWLVYLPRASTRTLVQYRPVLRHFSRTVAFKPRFVLEGAGLRLVAQPAESLGDVIRLVEHADQFVAAIGATDAFVRDLPAAFAPAGSHWSHHSGLGRLVLTMLDDRRPGPLSRLEDPGDEARQVVTRIGLRMAREVAAAGQRFRIVVLPSRAGLEHGTAGAASSWAGIVAAWTASGVEVLDLTPVLAAAGAATTPEFWMPGGHYSPRGHGLVAEALAERIGVN